MEIIKHQCNTRKELISTPNYCGVEIDIRSFDGKLILQHDPYLNGEYLKDWIKDYNHQTLIINVKEEGLENHILEIIQKYNIKSFFFLGQSFPFLIYASKENGSRVAIRISEYESINTALNLKDFADWVWIDFFTKFPINKNQILQLKNSGFKVCIVSPELQSHGKDKIKQLQYYLNYNKIIVDAVCTKYIDIWKNN